MVLVPGYKAHRDVGRNGSSTFQDAESYRCMMRASVLEQKLKAKKRLEQCSGKLTLHFSAPMFQVKAHFPSGETTEMSGKCVVALATGEEIGAAGNKKGLADLQGGGSQFWGLAQEVVGG